MSQSKLQQRETLCFSSKREYDVKLAEIPELFSARWLWSQHLRPGLLAADGFDGWCQPCGNYVRFMLDAQHADLREGLVCPECQLNARNRAVMRFLTNLRPDKQATRVYATEQASPAFRWLSSSYPGAQGSEFFDAESQPRLQAYVEHLLGDSAHLHFEDATRLTFASESFEAVISGDVLEHIPDYQTALGEFQRVLVPGGDLILTVPFLDAAEASVVRAELRADGTIRHLVEPEYHGDPVSPDGILAFHSFAWDLLKVVRARGFSEAYWCLPWQPAQALFTGLWTLHARK